MQARLSLFHAPPVLSPSLLLNAMLIGPSIPLRISEFDLPLILTGRVKFLFKSLLRKTKKAGGFGLRPLEQLAVFRIIRPEALLHASKYKASERRRERARMSAACSSS